MTDTIKYGDLSARVMAREACRAIVNANWFFDRMAYGSPRKPLTWRERIEQRLSIYRERVLTAWRVLRGDDIHEDCHER